MPIIISKSRLTGLIAVATCCLADLSARAEYHGFNTASGADGIVQEVRWPVWAESTYNAIYSQTLSGSDGGSCYFYGGMPSDPGGNPPCSIIWSFWPPSGTAVPGAAVTAYWTATNMYAPPHVGEGASGKVAGSWQLIQSNRWYREVFRIWQPADGTAHLGYTGRWLRDSASSNWYHVATMKIPFAATGLSGLSGFQEDFGHGNRYPRRTDYRNVYSHKSGQWQMANQFTPSVRQLGESGTTGLIENGTAAFFETCSGSSYLYNVLSNVPPTTGDLVMLVATNWSSASLLTNHPAGVTTVAAVNNYAQYTCVMTNQPSVPPFDPIVVSSSGATVSGNQLVAQWRLPATSSPQFAYQVEVFNNSGCTGSAAVVFYDIDPEARQKVLDITGASTPYARLSIIDVFNNTNTPIQLTPAAATLSPATNAPGAVNGLAYTYYESATNFTVMPSFGSLTPVYQGAVNNPDLTVRRQRSRYAFNYTGFISVPADGLYAFTLHSSDGSRLLVDGALVVNWDGEHSPAPLSGWAALQAGQHAVNVQYFFDNQNSNAGDLMDTLTVYYEGPGLAKTEVPDSAWFRAPGGSEPAIVLNAPANSTAVCSSNVTFTATATANGATLNKVQFYLGDNYWAQDATAPYTTSAFTWAAPTNLIRARLFYNTSYTLDSPASAVATLNMTLSPWLLAPIGDHVYPVGGKIQSGTYSIIGDGLNLLRRQVSGDCTLIAHLSGIISTAAAPDGQTASSGWEAGIMLKGNTNSTPGMPLGNSSSRYAAVYATVSSGTHFQDDTMSNGGGPYWSSDVGSANHWFKIQRVGDTFTTSVSADGAAWTAVNTNTLSGIGTVIYVGVFTYAASSQNPNVHWASFDSVSLTGNLVGPPEVSVTPPADTAYVGQSATFTALPGGNPPFSYQWQYDGVAIAAATNASLTLTNLQPTNSGLYTVILTNANGSAASTGTLTVLTPPPAPKHVLASGPVAYWRLNETAGSTAYDAVSNFNGTAEGNLVFGATGPTASGWPGFETNNLAAQFNGTDTDVAIPPLNLNTNTVTILGWVKRNGAQYAYAGICFCRSGGTVSGLHFGTANELRYTWNDSGSTYNWSSGLVPPDGVWTFVALAVEATRARVYMATNATLYGATNNVANAVQAFAGTSYLGCDPNQSARRVNGALDEFAIFNQALSPAQISQILNASLTARPTVSLTSPADGSSFGSPATINLTAGVATNGHTINKVQFFSGPLLLGESATPPYGFTWNNVPAGAYTLLAQVIYDTTNMAASLPANISVHPLPGVPQSLTATAVAANQISVAWSAAANATGYVLSRGGTPIASLADTGYLDAGLGPSSNYCYSVVATNPWGSSASSPTNCATTVASGIALVWDADPVAPGAQDGSGNWGSAATNWWNGAATVAWPDNVIASFGAGAAAASIVTITNDVTPAGVVFASTAGAYTIAGGGLNLSGSPAFNCQVDGAISATLKGSGSLVKTGPGTLTLSGANTYAGVTTISAGTLQLTTGGSIPGGVTDNAALVFNRSDSANFGGLISGTGTVTQLGTGTLTFTNTSASSYSGGTFINAGTVSLGTGGTAANTSSAGAFGTSPVTLNSGGNLRLWIKNNASFTLANNFVFNGGTLRDEDGTYTVSGTITVRSGGGAIQTQYGGKTLTLSGAMSGSGNLSLDNANNAYGTSVLYLSADNSAYSGTFTANAASSGWNGGQVSVNHNYALRNANLVMNTPRDILFGSGVTAPVFGSLTGTGNLTIPSGVTLSIGNNNTSSTFAGALLGSGALTKIGAGTLTLAGTNACTGATTISAGALRVLNSLASTAVTVANGGTLDGNGTVSGTVTVQSGGTLAPGTNAVGTLTTGAETWYGGGRYTFELNNATNSAGWDLLAINGALNVHATAASNFVIRLASLTTSNTPGPAAGFDRLASNAWAIATASGGAVSFAANKFTVDTSAFSNDFSGGSFSVGLANTSLVVSYAPPPPVIPVITSFTLLADGSFKLSGTGAVNQAYVLLAASNLVPPVVWAAVGTNTAASDGAFTFADLDSTNYPQKFYQMLVP